MRSAYLRTADFQATYWAKLVRAAKVNPKLMLCENDFAPAEAVTPRNPANRSGQHQLPTASNTCSYLTTVRSLRIPASVALVAERCGYAMTRRHTCAYLEQEVRRARLPLMPLHPWCRKARLQFRRECPCILLAGYIYPAHLQLPEQLLDRQELCVMSCNRWTRLVLATEGPQQDSQGRAIGPW